MLGRIVTDRVMAGVQRRHRPSWDGTDAGSPCLGLDWVPEDVTVSEDHRRWFRGLLVPPRLSFLQGCWGQFQGCPL